MDHDVSLLMPEEWCRMYPEERDFETLRKSGCLEPVKDFEHDGETVHASRLGYRITYRFVRMYYARVFNYPQSVFTEEMLEPEKQDLEVFVDAMKNITETHKRVSDHYFEDNSVEMACPPLKALLHIMSKGEFEGKGLQDPEVRDLFKRENMLSSDWYAERLNMRQSVDAKLWERHVDNLEQFIGVPANAPVVAQLGLETRLEDAKRHRKAVGNAGDVSDLKGTLGAQPV